MKGKALISEFQSGLSENCDTLTSHKDCAERNIREIQRRMKEDESRVVSSIKVNTSRVHIKLFPLFCRHFW